MSIEELRQRAMAAAGPARFLPKLLVRQRNRQTASGTASEMVDYQVRQDRNNHLEESIQVFASERALAVMRPHCAQRDTNDFVSAWAPWN
jgi:hypothetical protein